MEEEIWPIKKLLKVRIKKLKTHLLSQTIAPLQEECTSRDSNMLTSAPASSYHWGKALPVVLRMKMNIRMTGY